MNQKQKQNLTITSWNIQTFLDKEISDCPERCTTFVAHVLKDYNVDIGALRSQGLLEMVCFMKRKEETHSSGLAGLKEIEGNLDYAWQSRNTSQQSC